MIDNHKLEVLQNFSKLLQENSINHALSGSGLLYALGCEVQVNDWDLTNDVSLHQLKQVLGKHTYKELSGNPNYASAYLINLWIDNVEIDLIGSFAIRDQGKIININTVVRDYWNSIPLSCPSEWHKAYVAMNRPEKAKLLADYVS